MRAVVTSAVGDGLLGMLHRDDLLPEMEAALRAGEFCAVFQPLIDVATGDLVGVEGLCRWSRPGRTLIGPDVFIPLAESSGLIHGLGCFMLDECLAVSDRWRGAGRGVEVSVNVSPAQLATPAFTTYLAAQMVKRELPSTALTIEITESLPVDDLKRIVPRLKELRFVGVGVSLDDFGTGHASVAQLRRLPLTEVKFDRSLIQSEDRIVRENLRRAVDDARELGLRTVAEGIETPAHLDLARELGCDRAQGYFLGVPRHVMQVDALLAQ